MIKIPDKVHEELLNWSRWCWLGELPHPLPPTHCGSLEGQYRAPPEWNFEDVNETPRPSYIRPNERHARMVQTAFDEMPEPMRKVLKAEYPARHSSRRSKSVAEAAYYLAMPQWLYLSLLSQAVCRVEEAFAVCA
jgi:hypothetical protein